MPPLRQRRDREQKGLLLREKRLPLRAVAGQQVLCRQARRPDKKGSRRAAGRGAGEAHGPLFRKGGTYDAAVVLEDTGESVRFRLEFDKGART